MAKKAAKKKYTGPKFNDDEVANLVLDSYGPIIKSGSDVLSSIKDLKVLPFSPALDSILGCLGRHQT